MLRHGVTSTAKPACQISNYISTFPDCNCNPIFVSVRMKTNSYWPEVCGPAGRSMGNWSMGTTLAEEGDPFCQKYGNQLAELWDFAACQKYEDQLAELWLRAGRTMGSLLTDYGAWGQKYGDSFRGTQSLCFHFSIHSSPPIDRQEWGAPKFPGCTLKYKDPSSHFPCSLGSCI